MFVGNIKTCKRNFLPELFSSVSRTRDALDTSVGPAIQNGIKRWYTPTFRQPISRNDT